MEPMVQGETPMPLRAVSVINLPAVTDGNHDDHYRLVLDPSNHAVVAEAPAPEAGKAAR